MKKSKNPIIIAIIILILILAVIIYFYVVPENQSEKMKETSLNQDSLSENIKQVQATIQTIENTLSTSGQISSALDDKLYLYSSKYFDELLVEEKIYIPEGTNIVKYTDGAYLTAPYDCVVISSELPEKEEICTISNYIEICAIQTLAMDLQVSESDINKIEIGDEVNIDITATNEKITGYITSISEVGTYNSSGSYFTAKIEFENSGNLKIGMSATCDIVVERAENVISVPLEAIQDSDESKYVVVVNSDGSTSNINVETGISNDAYIEIKSGLVGSETIQIEESSTSSNNEFNFERFNRNGEFTKPNGGAGDSEIPSGTERDMMKMSGNTDFVK